MLRMRYFNFKLSPMLFLCASLLFIFILNGETLCEGRTLKVLAINITNLIIDPQNPSLSISLHQGKWISAILKEVYGNGQVSTVTFTPVADAEENKIKEASNVMLQQLDAFYPKAESDKIAIDIIMKYQGNVDEWWAMGKYPNDALLMTNEAASVISATIKDFKWRYPQGKVIGCALGIGSKVLLRAIESGVGKFDKIILFNPPKDEAGNLDSTLKKHPNTKFYTIFEQEVPIAIDDKTIKKIANEW